MSFLLAARAAKVKLNASQITSCEQADREGALSLDLNLGKRGWLFMARDEQGVLVRLRKM